MIDIEENLTAWRIDSAADFKRLWSLREELTRMITPRVKRLKYHNETMWLEELHGTSKCINDICRLVAHLKVWHKLPWNNCHPLCVHTLSDIDSCLTFRKKLIPEVGFASGKAWNPRCASINNENTHSHPKALHFFCNLFLVCDRASGHAIVFKATEALIMHELELIDVISCMGTEQTEVRRIVALECLSLCCRSGICSLRR